jgi:hypothetical protein
LYILQLRPGPASSLENIFQKIRDRHFPGTSFQDFVWASCQDLAVIILRLKPNRTIEQLQSAAAAHTFSVMHIIGQCRTEVKSFQRGFNRPQEKDIQRKGLKRW